MLSAKELKIISVGNAKNDQTDFALKSCSSNLLVNMIKFIVALRILVLSVMLNDVFPKSNNWSKRRRCFLANCS